MISSVVLPVIVIVILSAFCALALMAVKAAFNVAKVPLGVNGFAPATVTFCPDDLKEKNRPQKKMINLI